VADRDLIERMDGHMERIDRSLERIDGHMARGNELIEQIRQEFQLNREVQNELLARFRDSHREVMARLEDLGVHMREQTQALIRIQGRLST
jgi:branched-subunit amino acid aminotransferase/4-amino-4-deoxychorismate lyase